MRFDFRLCEAATRKKTSVAVEPPKRDCPRMFACLHMTGVKPQPEAVGSHGSGPEAAQVQGNVVERFRHPIPLTAAVVSCSAGRSGRYPEVGKELPLKDGKAGVWDNEHS